MKEAPTPNPLPLYWGRGHTTYTGLLPLQHWR